MTLKGFDFSYSVFTDPRQMKIQGLNPSDRGKLSTNKIHILYTVPFPTVADESAVELCGRYVNDEEDGVVGLFEVARGSNGI